MNVHPIEKGGDFKSFQLYLFGGCMSPKFSSQNIMDPSDLFCLKVGKDPEYF